MTVGTMRKLLGACVLAAAPAFAGPGDAAASPEALRLQVEKLIVAGFEHPRESLDGLHRLQREHAASLRAEVRVLTGIGLVEARDGRQAEAADVAEQLLRAAPEDPGGGALAAAAIVRAEAAFTAGAADVAAARAREALAASLAGCPPGIAAVASRPPAQSRFAAPDCEWRAVWSALRILQRHAEMLGVNATATAQAESTLRLAEWAQDPGRQTLALVGLARLAQERGERDAADRYLLQARHVAVQPPNPAEQARIDSAEASVHSARGEFEAALRFRERAVALATQADAPRLRAQMLTNLSDTYSRLHRPADALQAAEQALATVRSHNDQRAERTLVHNAGIAKIALGRAAEGKEDLVRVLELWRRSGETGRQVEALREFGEALAAAGHPRDALDAYHQERALSDALMRTNRDVALKELQTRNDADARQRDIELLARENALKTEAIANRDLLQLIWALLGAVLALGCGLVFVLVRRVRRTNRRLALSQVDLRLQSERDPLTHLANRRHCGAVMADLGKAPGGFAGALLLVDIDHFKRVNDEHGHVGGDRALVEVARRLTAAVRAGDLVVRWGGEEFLVLAPRASAEQAAQMAERILAGVGATPVVADGTALRITVSIGHASFPLPPHAVPLGWEEAVDLVDQALLAAKAFGRNRAIGIESTRADSAAALREVQAAFVAAWHDGRLTLRQTPGPTRLHEVPRPGPDQSASVCSAGAPDGGAGVPAPFITIERNA